MTNNSAKYYSITYPDITQDGVPSIVEHNGKLFCAYDNGLLSSNDGILWDKVSNIDSSSGFIAPILASFKGQLWCAYPDADNGYAIKFLVSNDNGKTWESPFKSFLDFTQFGENFTLNVHTSADGEEKLIVVYYYSVDEETQSLGLNFTTDGKKWSNEGKTTIGGFPTITEESKAFTKLSFPGYMALASFKATLYCIFHPERGVWHTHPAPILIIYNDSSNCFETSFVKEFPEGIVSGSSLVNTGESLWCLFGNPKDHGYISYMQSTDGKTWPNDLICFPNIYTRIGVTGLVFNDSLFMVNSVLTKYPTPSNPILGDGNFNIITNKENLALNQTTFKPETYEVDTEKNLSITTLCPRVHVKSVSCYVALGKGTDGNYYYVSFNQYGTTEPAYFSFSEEPSSLVKNSQDDSWVCFTAGNKLYIVDPATPTNHPSFNLSGKELLAPACGATENEIIVKDADGSLFVGYIESVTSTFHLSHETYQLSPSGNISPISIDKYLYLYNLPEDIMEVYNMSTSKFGTPICSTGTLGLTKASKENKLKVGFKGNHILLSFEDGPTPLNIFFDQYQPGASVLYSNRIAIEPISPKKIAP